MKKIILSYILCMLCWNFTSQNNAYYNRMQHIFGNIDKAKVTTGYLKEFGIRFNTIEDYDGVLDTLNFVDKTQWQNIYSSLYTMRVGTAAQNMISTTTIFNHLENEQNNSTTDVLLSLLFYNYQQYKSNAFTNGDVTVRNERIYDVAGRNPYETKKVIAISPLKKELQGNSFTFKLPNNLIYGNTGLTVSQMQIDFDNGQGYQNVSLNTDKSISYTSGGVKKLKYKLTLSDNNILYSHSKIFIDYIPNYQARFNGSRKINTIITGNAWQGLSALGKITVELADGHTQLTKPLIIVEGFDPNNSFNYRSLVENELYRGPGSLNIIINGNTNQTLNDSIENQGYDLVFVDFNNGTDYIQRNAYMLEKVIEWVNTEKNKNNNPNVEQNVVLGMSMGGLVARYALRHMELNNQIHDTKLYISHDTPHQGANVPLGIQAFARHIYGEQISIPVFFSLIDINIIDFADLIPELKQGFELLESPAAKQMLIYQLNGDGANLSHNNSMSQSFYNEYHSMGNPIQGGIKTIALANGSECGEPLDFIYNDTLINLDEKIDLPWFATNIVLSVLNAWSLNPLKTVSSFLSTDTDLKARFNVKALPNQESKEIYKGEIFISKTILGIFTVHEHLMDRLTLNSQSSMLPLDNVSGGIYDIDNFINLPSTFNSYLLQRKFSFIPTFSSLNISGGNQSIQFADLNIPYSPLSPPLAPKNVPFDNFYSNVLSNESHLQFTLNSGNWLLSELNGSNAFKSCASTCTNNLPLKINGANQVCNNSSSNYFVNNINSQAIINWSIYPTGGFSLTTNADKSVTVNPNGNFGGIATLTAEITTDSECNITSSYTVSKEIQTGAERPIMYDRNGNEIATFNFCTLYWENISFDTPPGTLEWEWNIGYGNFSIQGASNNFANVYSSQPTFGVLEVRRRDACGWSPKTLLVINFTDCQNNFLFKTYPNPTESILNIVEIDENTSKDKKENNSSISLFDFKGNLVKKFNDSKGQLNLNDLKNGRYVLIIVDGEHTEKHQIIKE